jgi:8-oxo-dGTP pyrophosphatase MutT (NUDIX family)
MQTKIIAAGGIVLNEKNELLMIFRRGFWDLPKGKLDEGESIPECAVREVQEETGLRNIELQELIGITFHEYEEKGHAILKETHWYKMHASDAEELVPQTEEDILQIEWVKKPDIAKRLEKTYANIIEILSKANI